MPLPMSACPTVEKAGVNRAGAPATPNVNGRPPVAEAEPALSGWSFPADELVE